MKSIKQAICKAFSTFKQPCQFLGRCTLMQLKNEAFAEDYSSGARTRSSGNLRENANKRCTLLKVPLVKVGSGIP